MIDAVLSYHTNPHTCGVAKFNQRLARELGVPCLELGRRAMYPLVSVKFAEINASEDAVLSNLGMLQYDVFAHDAPTLMSDKMYVVDATRVYAANSVIADAIRPIRSDVITAWCPSTVEGNATRGDIHVLTFGMAHKLTLPYYEKLKALLDDAPSSYTIGLSCAVHEGNPWDVQMQETEARMRALFGSHLRVLGYLGDDALVREIDQATAVAAFYDPALRANNTSAWAVLERGKPFLTNLDARSPQLLYAGLYDLPTLTRWPDTFPPSILPYAAEWPLLVERLHEDPCAN